MTLRKVLLAAGVAVFLVGAQFAMADCGTCPGDKAEGKAGCPAECDKACCAEADGKAKCDASKAACPKKTECATPEEKTDGGGCGPKAACPAPAENVEPAPK